MKIRILISLITAVFLIYMTSSCIIINQAGITESGQAETSSEQDGQETDDTGNGNDGEDDQTATDDLSDSIIVESPRPDQVITSPLDIEGQARGTWFFEATFPVRLLDAEGNIVAEYYAQTEEEWMTEEFVSFSSRLEFKAPGSDTGTLVLIKANPSDMREYDAQLEIPVRFR